MTIQNFQDGELGGAIREKINSNFTVIRETLTPITNPRGVWVPNTLYVLEEGVRRDSVTGPAGTAYEGKSYVVTSTHISGNTFALASDGGNWSLSSHATAEETLVAMAANLINTQAVIANMIANQ